MKILLFGGSGQLGYELNKRAHDLNFEVAAPVISEIDVSNRKQVIFLAKKIRPDLVINAAAYTAVDHSEEDKEEVYKINRDGAVYVAEAAKKIKARLIHISTDYVFDDSFKEPIEESAPTNPLNIYGASKLAGEEMVHEVLGSERSLIIRTSSLHGQKGLNFVHTMLKLFDERDTVQVVNDQYMSPTWAGWLAEVVLDLARIECGGILHATSGAEITWYDFACEIKRLADRESVTIEPVSANEFPRAAKRSPYSVLNVGKLTKVLGRPPMSWKDGLKHHLEEIGKA